MASPKTKGPKIGDAARTATTPKSGTAAPSARQAFRNARRGITGQPRVRRGPLRKAAAGLAAGGLAASKVAWRKWCDARKQRAAKAGQPKTSTSRKKGRVDTAVRRPGTARTAAKGATGDATPQARPGTTTDQPPTSTTTTGGTTMSRHLLGLAEDYYAAAVRDLPDGMLQVLADAYQLPRELERFADAMNARYTRAQEHPLHPAIRDMYQAVYAAQLAVVRAAAEIAPAIERLHEKELERLRKPRVGERMWDVRANEGTAAA